MRVRDGLWIVVTLALVPIVGIFGGYFVALCLLVIVAGAITLPVWLPLYMLARWLLWKSPRYRAWVSARWAVRDLVDEQKAQYLPVKDGRVRAVQAAASGLRKIAGRRP